MKSKALSTVLAAGLSLTAPLHAHRTNGLLQASLVEVLPSQVGVEVTLIPGMDIAPLISSLIDTNGDGVFSETESAAWSAAFMARQSVTVDGKSLSLKLAGIRTSPFADISDGHAEIVVRFTADVGEPARGARTVVCANRYQPITSSYQTNGLVPRTPGVRIHSHRRDAAQLELTLAAEFSTPAAAATLTTPANIPHHHFAPDIRWLLGLSVAGAAVAVAVNRSRANCRARF